MTTRSTRATPRNPNPVGHRLRHRTLRSALALVPLPWRPIPDPPVCPTDGTRHPVKTYHLNLDSDGACIVSRVIYENLRRAGAFDVQAARGGVAEFTYEGPVADPPAIELGMLPGGKLYRKIERVHIDLDLGV